MRYAKYNMKEVHKKPKKHTEKKKKAKPSRHVLDVKVRKPKRKTQAKHSAGKATQTESTSHERTGEIYRRDAVGMRALIERDQEQVSYKNFIMWGGVSFFMFLILFVWVANIKHIIRAGVEESAPAAESQLSELNSALDDIKAGLSEFNELKDKLGELNDYTQTVTTTLPSGEPDISTSTDDGGIYRAALSTSTPEKPDSDAQAELKERLESLENKLKQSSQENGEQE